MKWRNVSREEAANSPYFGLSGWLLLIYVFLVIGFVYSLNGLRFLHGIYFVSALVGNLLTLSYLVLLPMKHHLVPKIFIVFAWLNAILGSITIIFQGFPKLEGTPIEVHNMISSPGFGALIVTFIIIYTALLTLYFISSKRVNATYRLRLPIGGLESTAQPEGQFGIGFVLNRGISILFHNIMPFGLLTILVMSPPYIYALFADPSVDAGDAINSIRVILNQAAKLVLSYLVAAALIYGTIRELRGSRASVGECVSWGLRLLFPVIGIALLVTVAVGLGLLLVIVPGLILLTMWWVAVPAAVVERPGIIRSLRRSAELTKGHRWRVFAIIIIVFALSAVVNQTVASTFLNAMVISGSDTTGVSSLHLLAFFLVTVFFTAYGAVVSAVGYHDLRILREGVSVDDIAAVFE